MSGHISIKDDPHEAARRIREVLHKGETAVIPTDTVYGIIADPWSAVAVEGIFAAKRRPAQKSVQILCSDIRQAQDCGIIIPHLYTRLLACFPAGSLCIVCPASDGCRLATAREEGGMRTQAVRFPAGRSLQYLLETAGPVAASSANRSGEASATDAEQAEDELGEAVSLYVDGGSTPGAAASTVVSLDRATMLRIAEGEDADTSQAKLDVLREGVISAEDVAAAMHTVMRSQ